MTERPILFKGRLVRRILANAKTQTRRIAKLPPAPSIRGGWEPTTVGGPGVVDSNGAPVPELGAIWNQTTGMVITCPYGDRGDRLWVRETWCLAHPDCAEDFKAAEGRPRGPENYNTGEPWFAYYAATDPDVVLSDDHMRSPWKPSIHMPRWASRISLEITGARVERLQDISEEDAIAEGIATGNIPADEYGPPRIGYCAEDDGKCVLSTTARAVFAELWKSINGPESWDANPFVWVVEFKRAVPS